MRQQNENRGGDEVSTPPRFFARKKVTRNLLDVMPGFEEAWSAVYRQRNGQSVSPELRALVRRVYLTVLSDPLDLKELKKSLEELLTFLAGAGRTNANCWAVDLFFSESEGWERDWTDQNLPEAFHDVFAMMGEALHDTAKSRHRSKFRVSAGAAP